MTQRFRFVCSSVTLAAIVAGCDNYGAFSTLQQLPRIGLRHQVALMEEYDRLASYEASNRVDYEDAEYFASKGIAAALGEQVLPDTVESRSIPSDAVAEVAAARARLVAALYSGARELLPEPAAYCQAMFDCWLSELEEGNQPERLAFCRNQHLTCMADIMARPLPTAAPTGFMLAFASGSSGLGPAARTVVAEVITAARQDTEATISIVGHTDSVGSAAENLRLSIRRAEAVRDALVAAGIDPQRIMLEGKGEAEAVAALGDDVNDPARRQVVVTLP